MQTLQPICGGQSHMLYTYLVGSILELRSTFLGANFCF